MCEFCKTKLYFKVNSYLKPILAPLTHQEELEQELENITGEAYVELNRKYCPMCRKKVRRKLGE